MAGAKFTVVQDENVNFVINQGATINFSIEWQSSTVGFDAEMCIKGSAADVNPIAQFTIGNGRVVIGGANKLITFSMAAVNSAALPVLKNGVYGIRIINASGIEYPEISGKCDIIQQIC